MCCSSSTKHLAPQERSRDACSVQPSLLIKPLAAESFYAAVGIFCEFVACALLTPYKPSLTTEKKPGNAFCVARSPERPLAPKSFCATVGIFCLLSAPALKSSPAKERRQLRKKSHQHKKSYCAAVGIFARVLIKL